MTLGPQGLRVRFGPWRLRTTIAQHREHGADRWLRVAEDGRTGPPVAHRPRRHVRDQTGLAPRPASPSTRPSPGIDPTRTITHPGATITWPTRRRSWHTSSRCAADARSEVGQQVACPHGCLRSGPRGRARASEPRIRRFTRAGRGSRRRSGADTDRVLDRWLTKGDGSGRRPGARGRLVATAGGDLTDLVRRIADSFLGRCVRRFMDMTGIDRSMVLASQAFTSLIPLLILIATWAPAGEEDVISDVHHPQVPPRGRRRLGGDAAVRRPRERQQLR